MLHCLQYSAIYRDLLQRGAISLRTCSAKKARQYTFSFFPFLVEFLPLLLPALGVAGTDFCVSLACALPRDGETDVMMVGWTIHCKSGVVEIAVTVGANGTSDTSICQTMKINVTKITNIVIEILFVSG